MRVVAELPLITDDERAAIRKAPRTPEAHRRLLNYLPAMNAVQTAGQTTREALPDHLSVVAWNVERCLFPQESAAHISEKRPDIVLLSEVDHGMARTKQRHTTEEMATSLGMVYVFGVEFYEMGLGGETERAFCDDDFNARGWHGNAILSSVPFERVTMVRLDEHGHWFVPGDGDAGQPRVGGRNAILGVVPWGDSNLCVVSTHLESNSGADHRAGQFDLLMDAIDDFARDLPVLIGGDLNTGNHVPPDYDWRAETLFAAAEARGYDWSFTADGTTTRPSFITPHPDRQMKLDWFCGRSLKCHSKQVVSSIGAGGRPLSDHDYVWTLVGHD